MKSRDERGLSLVEILVAVAITGIVVPVMLQAMFVGVRNIDRANDRLAGSNDTQLIASFFTSDVASADTVSTTGTKSHAAPSVSPTVVKTAMVSFWSLKRATTLTTPDGMGPGWNTASPSFRIAMADEIAEATGPTGSRLASSGDGTSSITHSVALAPASGSITRRAIPPPVTTPGGQTLAATKPTGTVANDTLLAQVVVAGGTTTSVVAPAGWVLVKSQDSGTTVKSAIFRKLATSSEPATYGFAFKDASSGAAASREAAIAVAAYAGVLTTAPVNASATDLNPCGGDTPVLLLSWTDRHFDSSQDIAIQVTYNTVSVGSETQMVRRRCSAADGEDLTGIVKRSQTIASNLAPATAFASCVSSSSALATTTTVVPTTTDACTYLPVTVTMSLTEPPSKGEPSGRTYLVRGSTRTDREVG